MPPSKTYVADTKKWTDFFVNTASKSLVTNALHQKGGTLGNGTINNSKIVPIDSGYSSLDKRSSQIPGITIVSSAQRDLQQAKSKLRRERTLKKKKKAKKRKYNDNFENGRG